MANVNDFVNRLSGGGARANQYQVRLAGPGVNTEMLSFLCRSATMPASSVGEVAVPFRGRVVYVAGERTYADWTVGIFNDAGWTIRSQLEAWSNSVMDVGATTGGLQSPESYYGEADIIQLSRNEDVIWQAHLYSVWPTNIAEIALAYDTNDIVEEYDVTFRFNYMTTGPTGTGIGTSA
jgi:hypothetical protein